MSLQLIKEFKTFAVRGNVVDMAVGIIIGAAFGKIVTSLITDVIMPPLGLLVGGVDFSKLAVTLRPALTDAPGHTLPAVTLNYGQFINTVLDFAVVAFAVFLLVKGINVLRRQVPAPEVAPCAPPPPSPSERLLMEIRDLLKSRSP